MVAENTEEKLIRPPLFAPHGIRQKEGDVEAEAEGRKIHIILTPRPPL
jgi:hypothetical protein